MSRFRSAIFAIFGLASVVATQTPVAQLTPEVGSWRIPIHTSAADPVGSDYGLWAGGPGYKASFHRGFTFYPLRGRDGGPNRPLQWQTEAVLADGRPLATIEPRPQVRHGPWRCTIDHGAVTEIYDVRDDGVEQTFVVHDRPERHGDLIVVGRVSTDLGAPIRAPKHGAVEFCDVQGRPLVRYGAAYAIDATGRRTDLATSWDGERLRLHVAAEWLADACYPVTIDPLTSSRSLHSVAGTSGGEVLDSDVVVPVDDRLSDPGLTLFVLSREFASGDIDAYGVMTNRDLSNRLTIWTDLATSWSTRRPRCSHIGRTDQWVIVFERAFSSGSSGVRAYVHARSNGNLNAGTIHYLSLPSGSSAYRPDVGGSTGFNNSGDDCLVVYEQGPTGTAPSLVRGALLDPMVGFATGYDLHRGSASNRLSTQPSVIKHARGTSTFPWVVAWQERDANDPNDDWDLYVNRVYADATRSLEQLVGPHANESISGYSPLVDGDWGSYLIAYSRGWSAVPRQVAYQRFDWSNLATAAPTVQSERTLRRPLNDSGKVHGLAFDHETRSHWALVYQNSSSTLGVRRLGHSGGTVESATLHSFSSGVGAGGAAYGDRHHEFTLSFADVDIGYPLYGRRMTYDAASTSAVGSSCNPAAGLVAHDEPYAGDGNFDLTVGFPAGLTTTAYLLAAAAPASWPIPGAGSCSVYLDSASLFVVDSRPGVSHNTFFRIPLPDDPVFLGDVYFQVVYLNPSANPLQIETTNGLRVNVR